MIQAIRKVLRRWSFDPDPQKAIVEELNKISYGEVTLDPASLAAATNREDTVALPAGTAAAGDLVFVQPPSNLANGLVVIGARISAADTLAIRFYNPTAGAIDSPSGVWTYHLVRNQQIAAL